MDKLGTGIWAQAGPKIIGNFNVGPDWAQAGPRKNSGIRVPTYVKIVLYGLSLGPIWSQEKLLNIFSSWNRGTTDTDKPFV